MSSNGSKICPECGTAFTADHETCPQHGARLVFASPERRSLVGTVLDDRYELKELLGEGGMGAVYRAWQRSMQREVAVKILHRDVSADLTAVRRFVQEAQNATHLAHPHVVTLFDFGQSADGLLYIVMELLQGRSLSTELREAGPVAAERAVALLCQVCDALTGAHDQGTVHRDLKPDNIFLLRTPSDTDFVKVLDFGIAKVRRAGRGHTLTGRGTVVGTPAYMSPEQATGGSATPASDVYSLGCILYEMLCGEPPFHADSPTSLMLQHVNEPVPSLRAARQVEVPAPIDALVLRVLSKNPELRPATARALNHALQEALAVHERQMRPVALQGLIGVTLAAAPREGSAAPGGTAPAAPVHVTDGQLRLLVSEPDGVSVSEPTRPVQPITSLPTEHPTERRTLRAATGARTGVSRRGAWITAGLVGVLVVGVVVAGWLWLRGTDAAGPGTTPAGPGRPALAAPPPAPAAPAAARPATAPAAAAVPAPPPDRAAGAVARPAPGGGPSPVSAAAGKPEATPPPTTPAPEATPRPTTPAPEATPPPTTPTPEATRPSAAAVPEVAHVRFTSEPAGARVLRDKTVLGTTPCTLALPRSDTPLELVVTARGYRSARVSVVPSGDGERHVTLVRRTAGRRPGTGVQLETW